MGAGVAELDRRPFPALTDYDILDLAKPVRESLAPAMVIGLIRPFSGKFLATGNVFKIAIRRDDFCAPVRVSHIPGLVELSHGSFGRMHRLDFSGWRGNGAFPSPLIDHGRQGAAGQLSEYRTEYRSRE